MKIRALLLVLLSLGAHSPASFAKPGSPPVRPDEPPALIDDVVDSPLESKSVSIVHRGPACSPCWGEVVDYTSFSQPIQTYAAQRYDGYHVTLLLPLVNPRGHLISERHIRGLVDRLDILYINYRDLLGWEPPKRRDPAGKQIFAVLPNDPNFRGLAKVAADSSEYSNAILEGTELDFDILDYAWPHELAHNFDPIAHWDYGADPYHAWTTLLDAWFIRKQARHTLTTFYHWTWVHDRATSYWDYMLAQPEFTWWRCIAPARPEPACGVSYLGYDRIGAFALSMERYLTDTQMRDWLRQGVKESINGISIPEDPESRNDAMLASLAAVTRSDPSCLAQILPWNVGPGAQANGHFDTPFAACRDDDQDGFIGRDDCDDTRSDANPLAVEQLNGLDDDCDSLADDVLIDESTQSGGDFSDNVFDPPRIANGPVNIEGTLFSEADIDSIGLHRFAKSLTGTVCSHGGPLIFYGLPAFYDDVATDFHIAAGECRHIDYGGPWRGIGVRAKEGSFGGYSISLEPHYHEVPSPRIFHLEQDGDGIRGVVNLSDIRPGSGEVRVRWFISGSGMVKDLPLSAPGSLNAPPVPDELMERPGYPVQVRAQLWRDEMPIGEPTYPLTVNRASYALPNGKQLSLRLAAGQEHRKLFVDVPEGAQSLAIESHSAGDIDLFLLPVAAPTDPWPDANIAPSPPANLATHQATTLGDGAEYLRVEGAALKPGRWYVVARNSGESSAGFTLTATVSGVSPRIRPGSYFNPGRSGHGIFLYPAGDQWTALWYTYRRDATPTWFYIQGPAPGADGIWSAPMYRSHWVDGANVLSTVGSVLLTPTGPDAFTWTFDLEGDTGSEPMQALGRGCPPRLGGIVNASANWFDPRRPGIGHSTQFWEHGYKYVASFIYDEKGFPRFVSGEAPYDERESPVESHVLVVASFGACPLCLKHPSLKDYMYPSGLGYMTLGFSSVALNSISYDLVLWGRLDGQWSGDDRVQPLGQLQGCSP